MDLTELTESDLVALLDTFRALALNRNRVAADLFHIVGTELMRRSTPVDIGDYSDHELGEATTCLCSAVDMTRASGVPDEYPAVQFLRLNITALVAEMERRGMIQQKH